MYQVAFVTTLNVEGHGNVHTKDQRLHTITGVAQTGTGASCEAIGLIKEASAFVYDTLMWAHLENHTRPDLVASFHRSSGQCSPQDTRPSRPTPSAKMHVTRRPPQYAV